ncbi:acetyltransferase [Maribacter hydrothermalis]|uniref:Acetyltransferase n=1 Tax=Maribacter hydrothermalis TaxID=1836467 RepID=A0A1B7ZE52_9FLAO|nr:acetyltransferase [Maribacter hydrothermalis]APQ17352.1 acetyltransferase [Maribacter hydrothermalis]OBR41830.1 acetyltransferase [Maribacter hydrothermalis]
MSKHKNIFFLGYSGHAYVAIEVARANELNVLGYFDKLKNIQNPFNLLYCGIENDTEFKKKVKNAYVFPAIGANNIREKLHRLLIENNIEQIVLIDPSAHISNSAVIGESTLVNPNVSINSLATIGNGCIINTGSIVEHECLIDDYTHIAPGAVLAGNVKIGKNCFIGANAVIKQGIIIADNVTVGAGSVILNNITEKGIWVGNPAKQLLKK